MDKKATYSEAEHIARRLFGDDFRLIDKGKNNWVFENDHLVLTIPKIDIVQSFKGYTVRVAANKRLASEGLPIPEVVEYSKESEINPEYLLVRKIEGDNIDLSKMSLQERNRVHETSGEMLRRIHSIAGSSYGRVDGDLKGTSQSWSNFLDSFFEEAISRVKNTEKLWEDYGRKLKECYETSKEKIVFPKRPSFLHGDFHLGNLLVKNGKIAAILDLDLCSSGDPCWDTGHYCHTFNIDRCEGIKSFRRGYGSDQSLARERLYCLMIWTRKLGTQAIKRPDALKETIPELEKILRGEI